MTSVFWDDLAADLECPEFAAEYARASELIAALDGIANASREVP